MSLGQEFGEDLRIRAHMAARATIGLSDRVVLWETCHIETAELLIKYALGRQDSVLVNGRGEHKPAGVLTKPVPQEALVRHLGISRCRVVPADARP